MDLFDIAVAKKLTGGGDHDAEDGIIARTISGVYENSRVSSIGASAFVNCWYLEEAHFQNVSYINRNAFDNCSALKRVVFQNLQSIGLYAFSGCRKLSEAYFLGSSVPTVTNSNIFQYTPFTNSSSAGSIFVPASLVDSYKVASYWSYFSSRITSYVE